MQVSRAKVTGHSTNGKIQIRDPDFVKENFEKIDIHCEYGSISATIEFVIISNIIGDKIHGGALRSFLGSPNYGKGFASGDSLHFAK